MYAVGHSALSRHGEFLKEVLIAGEGAALSHEACAEFWVSARFVGDLTGTLTAPSGAQARVFQRLGGSGNNY